MGLQCYVHPSTVEIHCRLFGNFRDLHDRGVFHLLSGH